VDTQASASAEGQARPAATDTSTPGAAPGVGDLPQAGFTETLHALWDDARGALTERVRLATLELRLATMTLLQVVVLAVVVAVLAVTAWLCLVGGVVAAFVGAGLHWGLALAIVVLINGVVAALLVRSMLRAVQRVGLPKSLRRINTPTEA